MKKILINSIILILLTFSCDKNHTYCYDCYELEISTIYVGITELNRTVDTINVEQICDEEWVISIYEDTDFLLSYTMYNDPNNWIDIDGDGIIDDCQKYMVGEKLTKTYTCKIIK